MDVETWLNTTEQSGRMVGDGGSIEWSDDDAVKSGSNTEGDVAEEPPADKKGKKTFRTPITTLNMKHDPISTILGKIDAEISALSTKSQSVSSAGTGSTVVYRPSTPSRSPQRNDEDLNRSQHERSGPMKATQNFNGTYSGLSRGRESPMLNGDANMSSRGRESPLMNNEERPHYNGRGCESPSLNVGRGRESPSMNGDDRAHYSGRGRESPLLNSEDRLHAGGRGRQSLITNGGHRMNGASDMCTDNGDHQRRRSDLESNSSNAVDEKFKKILRKRTGYTEKSAAPPSDTDTIRTEDFNRKFQDSLVYSSGFQDEDQTDQTGSQINTEEPESKSIIDRLRPKRSKSSPPVYNKHKPTNNALRKPTYVSDAESVRTEDFEFRFKDLIVNQMDSEADLTDNDPLHAKVKEILQVTLPYKKNERERTQSENGLRFRDRRKETSNGELTYPSLRAPSDQRNNMVNGDIHHQNGDLQLSSREPPEYRNGMVDSDHSNKSTSYTRQTRRDSLDSDRQEIERESERIQREIEMERRAQSFSPRRTKTSTRGMLSITGELPKATSYTDLSTNSPRDSYTNQRSSSLLERARTGLFQDRFNPSHDASEGRARSSSSPDRSNSSPEKISSLRDKFSMSTPNRGTSPIRDRVRNGTDGDWASPVNSNLSSPRYTSSQVDQASPRNMEDKLSVSFQDLPNSPNQSATKYSENQSSPYINNLSSEPKRTNYRSTSLDRERPRDGLVSAMKGSRSEVKEAEKKLQLIKAQTDEAKTQLMLTELKRENIMKDVDRIEEDLSRKKRQVKNYEDQLRSRLGDIRASDSFVDQDDKGEKMTSLEEENASLKVRLRHMDGLELERDELVRQLDAAKDDLFNEQRQSRNKIEELQEEIEIVTAQLEESKMTPGQGQSITTSLQTQKFEEKVRRLEKEKNDLVQDKKKLLEDLRLISRSPRADSGRHQLINREVEDLKTEISNLHGKIGACQKEINNKEDIIGQLKQQNQDLQQLYSKEKGHKDGVMEEHKRSLQTLRKEMDTAMVQMRENMFLEKQKSLEDLRSTLEKEKRDALSRAEEKMNHHIKSQSNAIREKEGELSRMIDLVKKLEEDRRDVETRVKSESQKQMDDIITREKLKLEADLEWRLHKEKDQAQQELKVKLNALSKELEEEKKVKSQFLSQVEKLTTELETQRLQNRQAVHDRMVAVARAKEAIKQDMQVDMEKLKAKMKEDFQQELDKLQNTIRMQEEEIKQLRAERAEVLKIAQDNQASERIERTIVNEINEECRKNSHMLGISPRKVNVTDFRENGFTSSGRMRAPTTAALANLRACNSELRNHVQELKQEVEHQKSQLIKSQREKSDIVQSVKSQLEREKSYELDKLKEKFVKDHADEINGINKKYIERDRKYMKLIQEKNDELHKLKDNFEKWKKETDSWLMPNGDLDSKPYTKSPPYEYGPRATAQEQELERLEREIHRLTTNQQQRFNNSFVQDDISTTKTINNLRNKVAELERENSNLSKYSYSVPDLSDPIFYRRTMRSPSPTPQQERIVNILEQRAKEGDFESDTLLDQQQRSRSMMSQKMQEMTKLQTSLTSQTKDLIHLGQAYSKLNNNYRYGKT